MTSYFDIFDVSVPGTAFSFPSLLFYYIQDRGAVCAKQAAPPAQQNKDRSWQTFLFDRLQ